MFKNVAGQKVTLFVFDATTGLPKTGDAGQITVYVSKDDGTTTVLGDISATEVDSTNDRGAYRFDLTQAETNADKLEFSGKSSTSTNIVLVRQTIYTVDKTGYSLSASQAFNLTGNITGNLSGSVGSVAGLTASNLDAAISSIPTASENADALLARNVAGGSDGTATVSEALYPLRFGGNTSGSAFNVKNGAGTTAYSLPISTDADAIPIIGIG